MPYDPEPRERGAKREGGSHSSDHGCLGIQAEGLSHTQQAEGVDAARTQPAGRGTDQKRARACTKASPYVFEPEMPRWIAQELRKKRQAIAAASREAVQVTQERPCRSCAAETAGLPLAGIDGEAVCLNPQPLRLLSRPRACVRPSLPPFRVRHPAPLTRLPGTHSSSCQWFRDGVFSSSVSRCVRSPVRRPLLPRVRVLLLPSRRSP